MTFVADAMLGRLARWMRFLGYDVLYFRDINDRELVRIARSESRVILTRDRRLPRDYNVRHVMISSEKLNEQLTEVLSKIPLLQDVQRRCMKCNAVLKYLIKKDALKDLIPEYIYLHHNTFQRCPTCGSIYWQGSHTKNIMMTIDKINLDGDTNRLKIGASG